jgi:uncharacterized integral membrane protein
MKKLKIICILTLPAVAAAFVYQNTEAVQLTFLFWSLSMSVSLIVLAAFLAGFIGGLLLLFLSSRKKGSKAMSENMR